eukprot:gene14750-20798_t
MANGQFINIGELPPFDVNSWEGAVTCCSGAARLSIASDVASLVVCIACPGGWYKPSAVPCTIPTEIPYLPGIPVCSTTNIKDPWLLASLGLTSPTTTYCGGVAHIDNFYSNENGISLRNITCLGYWRTSEACDVLAPNPIPSPLGGASCKGKLTPLHWYGQAAEDAGLANDTTLYCDGCPLLEFENGARDAFITPVFLSLT